MAKKPVALLIMDGYGYNPDSYGNAIAAANTPNLDKYMQGPKTIIGASGLDVGLHDERKPHAGAARSRGLAGSA